MFILEIFVKLFYAIIYVIRLKETFLKILKNL